MVSITVKEMLEAGVHFGHQTRRWNPKMKEFIFGARNGIYIIDLQKTSRKLREALAFISDVGARGGQVLFVGTKRQAQESVAEASTRAGMHYVNQRWLGGTLTNFSTIRKRIQRLRELEEMAEGDAASGLTKKEIARLDKERGRLSKTLSGIKSMERLPQALFVIDTNRERIAVAEANKLKIPVVAVVDTNCDPQPVDFPIPANDDAIRAIQLFSNRFADCLLEARAVWETTRRDRAADGEKRVAAGTPQSIAERVREREARRERVRQKAQRAMGHKDSAGPSVSDAVPATADKSSTSE